MKRLIWHRTSLQDLLSFPMAVRKHVGYALYQAQCGIKHEDAKPLKGMNGVMEVVSRHDKNTYRSVYYTKIRERVFVLHCFQKKSTHGIATPKHEIDVIKKRLKEVME